MEVNWRHNFIRTRASGLVFWKSRVTGKLSLKMISLEEIVDRDSEKSTLSPQVYDIHKRFL